MKSYSEDLREKIVVAVERGMSKSEAARIFSVSLSSVKRYSRMASSGESLAPKERLGRTPKVDETTKRLLNKDMKERPAATIMERIRFLEVIAGKRLSYSTVWRLLKRLGWSRKKDQWVLGDDLLLKNWFSAAFGATKWLQAALRPRGLTSGSM